MATPRHLRVTLVVDITIPDVLPPHLAPVADDEDDAGRLVESIALRALAREGLEPVSGGYGYSVPSASPGGGR